MRCPQQFSITLPTELADAMRAKVAAGEYATASDVIRDGVRTLLARDRPVEDWLRDNVAGSLRRTHGRPIPRGCRRPRQSQTCRRAHEDLRQGVMPTAWRTGLSRATVSRPVRYLLTSTAGADRED